MLLDGRLCAAHLEDNPRQKCQHSKGRPPHIAFIRIGDDHASTVYVRLKEKKAKELGMLTTTIVLPTQTSIQEAQAQIHALNTNDSIDGILLQLPLPAHLDAQTLTDLIDPVKDVDGLTTTNLGKLAKGATDGHICCTPLGIIELLTYYNIPLIGSHAVVLGRSQIVGTPLALLLSQQNATVTICHSKTKHLDSIIQSADILISATGRRGVVNNAWLNDQTVVVDVGIHRTENGLCGDLDGEFLSQRSAPYTPVPGGVGPMTICMLLHNTWNAYLRRQS